MLESTPASKVVRGAWQTAASGRNGRIWWYDSGEISNWTTTPATNLHTSRACARARAAASVEGADVRIALSGGSGPRQLAGLCQAVEMRRHSALLFFLFFSFSRFSI